MKCSQRVYYRKVAKKCTTGDMRIGTRPEQVEKKGNGSSCLALTPSTVYNKKKKKKEKKHERTAVAFLREA